VNGVTVNAFAEIMRSVAQRMRAEFAETAAASHRGGKGATREEIVQSFLARYLPGHVEATARGEIITASGEVSAECDILIADRSTPPLLDKRDFRIVPSECVHGVVEVKSRLDGRELRDACEKIKRAKSLPKTAYSPSLGFEHEIIFYGRPYRYTPTAGLIFAFDSMGLEEVASQFARWCAGQDAALVPDGIWILGKGYLLWAPPRGENFEPRPAPGYEIAVVRAHPSDDIMLQLAIHLSLLFAYAWMPPLKLQDYGGGASEGEIISRLPVPDGLVRPGNGDAGQPPSATGAAHGSTPAPPP